MSADSVWRAVADPTRRRLIELLRDGPRTTGELCRAFPTTRFAVMKHLAVLERCGVVVVHRSGRTRFNSLNPVPLGEIERRWPETGADGGLANGRGPGPGSPGSPATVPDRPLSFDVFLDAPPWRVFDALTVNVAAWWGAPHLLAADATNIVLEPQPGGRFYEEWGHRQGVLRGVVSAIRQDERLDITGPVFGGALLVLSFLLARREGGTLLTVSWFGRGGPLEAGVGEGGALEDLVRGMLKAFVEHGTMSGPAS